VSGFFHTLSTALFHESKIAVLALLTLRIMVFTIISIFGPLKFESVQTFTVFYYECEVRMKTMQKMLDKGKFTPIKLVDVSHLILKTHRKKPKFPVTALRFALSTL